MKEVSGKDSKMSRNGKIYLELVIFAVIAGLGLLLPFARYRYNGLDYVLSGYHFLTGKTVCGGKVVFGPDIFLWTAVVSAVGILVVSAIGKKISAKFDCRAANPVSDKSVCCHNGNALFP